MSTALRIALEVALLWVAGVKLWHLRRSPGDRPLRAVAGICTCLALGPLAALPGLHEVIEGIVPGLAKLLLNLLTVTATYYLMAFYGFSVGGSGPVTRLRRLRIGLLTAHLVMIVAWATAPEPIRIAPAALENLDNNNSAVFTVAALGYMGLGLTYAFRWSVSYARVAHRARLRTSLRIVAVALAALLTACLTKAGLALALGVVPGLEPGQAAVVGLSGLCAGLVLLGTLVLVTGFSYPAVASWPARVRQSRERRRLYRRLGPLWHRMRAAFPELVLTRTRFAWFGSAGWMPWTYRAYFRRVIEIRDTIVQLAPYLDPEVVRGERVDDPQVWARLTADALNRREQGRLVENPFVLPLPTDGDDLDSDARRLAALADAMNQLSREPVPVSSEPVVPEPVSSSTSSIRKT